jgi:hypothetical protein
MSHLRAHTAHAALVVATLAMGCGDPWPGYVPGTDGGAEMVPPEGGSLADGGGGRPPDEIEGIPATNESATRSDFVDTAGGSLGACFGADGAAICEPALCSTVRSCCVDDGTCCSPIAAPPVPATIDLTTCSEGDPARDCLPPAWVFGFPEPYVTGSAITPGGDATGDSGLVLGDAVDLGAHRVVLEGTFTPSAGCADACVESVGLGVTAQDPIASTVRPIAALVLSGSRQRMSFVVGDGTIAQWDVTGGETWTLDLRPSGDAVVKRGGVEVASATFARARAAHVVLYGRTMNSTTTPTRVGNVRVTTSLCDMADAFGARTPLTVRAASGEAITEGLGAPSLATLAGTRALAFALGGEIWVATATGVPDELVATTPTALLTAENLDLGADVALDDPELVETQAGAILVFFTIRPSGSPSSIGVATLSAGLASASDARVAIEAPPAHLEAPTAHLHHSGQIVLVARQHFDEGPSQLLVFHSADDGASFLSQSTANLSDLTTRGLSPSNEASFDADELGHPSLTVHDGAWQLTYAGRRGSRWAIGLLVSDDAVWWRPIREEDGVFASARTDADVVGVTAPDTASAGDRIDMVYLALDGVGTRVYETSRAASPLGYR